jgi:hypothetical protein
MKNFLSSSHSRPLGTALEKLSSEVTVMIKNEARARMRERVLQQTNFEVPELSPVMKAALRQRVMNRIERRELRREKTLKMTLPVFGDSFVFLKRGFSFAVLSVFTFALVAVSFSPVATFAQRSTTLQVVHGHVDVLRGGKVQPSTPDMTLLEGDEIRVGDDGEAVISYFDRSFSRLFPGTHIELKRLYDENTDDTMVVEVDLNAGKVWSRVLDLVSQSEFTVHAENLIASAYHRATFVVSAEARTSSVQVIQNAIGVKSSTTVSPQPLLPGFRAVVSHASRTAVSVQPVEFRDADKAWVTSNLEKDQKLLADSSSVDSRPVVAFSEASSLLLGLDDVEKAKVSFTLLAQKSRDFPMDSTSYVQDLERVLQQAVSQADGLRQAHAEKARVLDALIQSQIVDRISDLAAQAQELQEKGDFPRAQEALNAYKSILEKYESGALREDLSRNPVLVEKMEHAHQLFALLSRPDPVNSSATSEVPPVHTASASINAVSPSTVPVSNVDEKQTPPVTSSPVISSEPLEHVPAMPDVILPKLDLAQ